MGDVTDDYGASQPTLISPTAPTAPTISRTYEGRQGIKDFHEDAAKLAGYGYTIASQIQTPGTRTAAASLFVAVGATLLVLGVIVYIPLLVAGAVCLIIGLVSGKGPDELAVVWVAPKAGAWPLDLRDAEGHRLHGARPAGAREDGPVGVRP